jgi:CheY-like chemotaxis protein
VLTISTAQVTVTEAPAVEDVDLVPGDYVRVSVADTGSGMTAAVASRIFDPFFTTKPVGEGTGLGLATVYGIVKQSGGHVFVQTVPDRGSTFDVYLPATGEGVQPTEAPSAPAAFGRAAQGRVLLVEDEDVVRELLQEALRERGYDVVPAASGDQALASLAAGDDVDFDVVVTDVVMPGTSGREVAAAVRARSPHARVVYVSGYARDIVDDDALDADTSFLQKPFAMRDLVAKVDELLAQRAA